MTTKELTVFSAFLSMGCSLMNPGAMAAPKAKALFNCTTTEVSPQSSLVIDQRVVDALAGRQIQLSLKNGDGIAYQVSERAAGDGPLYLTANIASRHADGSISGSRAVANYPQGSAEVSVTLSAYELDAPANAPAGTEIHHSEVLIKCQPK